MLVSCGKGVGIKEEISLTGIRIKDVPVDTSVISELFVPSDIYSIGGDIVLVNGNKSRNVFYRYDTDMRFLGSYLFYGNGRNEFNFISGSTQNGNDSTLCLYTDLFNCAEFLLSGDSIMVAKEYRILDGLQNNVIVLNDSLVFYRMLQGNYPFGVYNRNTGKHEKEFGNFPKSSIRPETEADRDNVCLSTSVYDRRGDMMFSFYETLPVVRIYDMSTYRLVKEIVISDAKEQIRSLDEYYDDRGVVYFFRPIFSGDMIYVAFINDSPDNGVPEDMELLTFDRNGAVVARYRLDRYCPVYTVTETGVLYGVALSGDEYVLCRADLFGHV